jgi:hypothetical protein
MATDQHLGPETNPSPHADPETGGPVRELAEALTALGHYLAAANRILIEGAKSDRAQPSPLKLIGTYGLSSGGRLSPEVFLKLSLASTQQPIFGTKARVRIGLI